MTFGHWLCHLAEGRDEYRMAGKRLLIVFGGSAARARMSSKRSSCAGPTAAWISVMRKL